MKSTAPQKEERQYTINSLYCTQDSKKKSVIFKGFHEVVQIFNIQYDHPSKDLF